MDNGVLREFSRPVRLSWTDFQKRTVLTKEPCKSTIVAGRHYQLIWNREQVYYKSSNLDGIVNRAGGQDLDYKALPTVRGQEPWVMMTIRGSLNACVEDRGLLKAKLK
ncbi:hypothetical protein J6590_063057 [Homalodisca vitripennis]|nr:hypothetical protein J6590_063057 [Homalodisca vitripennis]